MFGSFRSIFLAAISGFLMTSLCVEVAHAQGFEEPISGAFGIELGANVDTALAAGFERGQYKDGGIFYRKVEREEFFQIKIVKATYITDKITSVQAKRTYQGDDAEKECKDDLQTISYEVQDRYPTLQLERVPSLEWISFLKFRTKGQTSDKWGRSIELICNKHRGIIRLSVEYMGSPAEFEQAYIELVKHRNAQEAERRKNADRELKKRGIDPNDL